MRTLKIFFHDNCFDGTASASVFSDFYRKHIDLSCRVVYQGVQHKSSDPFEGLAVDGDDNACVDFRYDERMSWWFDHHVSAFQPPSRRKHFDADDSGKKFYDPTARSNTMFQVRMLSEHFQYELPDTFNELIEWADIIDSARFASPESAVALDLPATRLMTWVRHNKDAELTHRYIDAVSRMSLAEVAEQPWITKPLEPLIEQHKRTMELIRKRAMQDGNVVFVDLIDEGINEYNSFISYFLFPDAKYTVGVVRSDDLIRISVGFNPWSNHNRSHNIAEIC
ncbi:MAG: hypothetical protein AAGC55_04630, partial [Myxococcota bacterium]